MGPLGCARSIHRMKRGGGCRGGDGGGGGSGS